MAITKNIVDMMGGTIEVQTAQGKGTEFTVCVPMRAQTEQRPVEKITELEGLKALVVDDDFNTCDSVTKMLVKVGMRAEWTLSGKEAVFACAAVYRDERCLPRLYHRLASAGYERHRGHPPDPQPAR